MGFLLLNRKRKVIRSSSIHICWFYLCKILFYVRMFTVQRRGEICLLNFLFFIDYRHQQMCKIFFLGWQAFLKRIFHNQTLCWSRMESETTEPCSQQMGWAPCPPGRLNPDSSALTQFVPRLADVKRFEDLPFNSEWFFVPNSVACDDSIIISLEYAEVAIETRCMVLCSPRSLLNSLLLFGGNCFRSAEVPGNTACSLQRAMCFELG